MSKIIKIKHFTFKDQITYIHEQLDELGKGYLELLIEFIRDQSNILAKLGINELDFKNLVEAFEHENNT